MSFLLDIWRTFKNSEMTEHIQYHIDNRYRAIEKRVIDTIDYVEPAYDNRFTYSFHYASILRDIGSCFDSTISEIIESEKLDYPLKIGGFLKFLKNLKRI